MARHEEDITDEALKQEMDKVVHEELGDDQSESPTDEESSSSTSTEDVKSVKEDKVEETEDVDEVNGGKPVPYSRFKEAQEQARKAKEYEEFLSQNSDLVKRDPATNRLVRITKEESVKNSNDDDLTDEDLLAFDDHQMRVIEKITAKREREAISRIEQRNSHYEQTAETIKKCKEEFPDFEKKESEFYKKADEILCKEYVQWGKDGKSYYIPPKAHYEACIKAERIIKKEAEQKIKNKEEAKKEELKNKNQNKFVERSSKKAPIEESASDKDLENMSRSELDDLLEKETMKSLESL